MRNNTQKESVMDKYQELREMIINEIVYQKNIQKGSEKSKLIEELSSFTDYSRVEELSYWSRQQGREIAENPYGY
jgi:hypothetical protein